MRVTQFITYNTYINDIMRRQESIYDNDKMLSTGKRVNKPSDDPVSAGSLITSKGRLSETDQYERNISYGLSYLTVVESTLSNVKNVLTNLQEIAVSEATGTATAESRSTSATVVGKRLDELIGLGNTMLGNDYVFSGYKTDTASFDSSGAYQGDANKKSINIGPSTTTELGVNGGEVMNGTAGGVDIMQIVTDLTTALNANDTTGIQNSIADLDTAFTQVSNAKAQVGAKSLRLTAADDILQKSKYDLQIRISDMEDADLAKVISDLHLGQTALEAAITSAGKVLSINIFNYI